MKRRRVLVALVAVALIAAGCSRSGDDSGGGAGGSTDSGRSAGAASGDFGDLKGLCHPGSASSASAQGVTAKEIKVGVFTDMGFTKVSEFGITCFVQYTEPGIT